MSAASEHPYLQRELAVRSRANLYRALLAGALLAFQGACASAPGSARAEQEPSLSQLLATGRLRPVNRTVTPLAEPGRAGVRLNEQQGAGIVWIEGVEFGEGTIEVDIRGRDVLQRSFPGVAFHAASDSAYDAVYLRPFNFRATDPVRRVHAVQYISVPGYDWPRLRQERPGEFEKAVEPAPAPDAWVRLRIVVEGSRVSAYVGEGTEPDLVVSKLGTRTRGRVGLWVGTNSDGDFANLRITPAAR